MQKFVYTYMQLVFQARSIGEGREEGGGLTPHHFSQQTFFSNLDKEHLILNDPSNLNTGGKTVM